MVAAYYAFVAPFLAAPVPCNAQETTFMRDEDGYVESIDQRYIVDSEGSLTLKAETGSIKVDSWTNDEVEIHIEKQMNTRREDRARSAFDEVDVVLSRQDNDVHIRVVDKKKSNFLRNLRNRVSVKMTIRVPEFYTLDLSTVDGSIEIENMKGPVTARAVDGDIEIGPAESQVNAGTTDGNIEIAEVTGSITARAVDGDIEIESTNGHVKASTTDGDIEIRNTRGTVTANAVDGDIEIGHATGDVIARTNDGDIEIRNTQGAVTAQAVDGRIETRTTAGDVDAGTLKGDIDLYDTKGYVKARATRGSIAVDVARANSDTEQADADPPIADPDADTRFLLETTEGDLTIYLPEDLSASIEADGSSGGLLLSRLWRDEAGRVYSDFRLNQSEWGVFFYRQSEASGDINGGGDRIRLQTNSGNIYIKERNR